nr:PREDICTED: protein CC2D2B isoform X2 [Anolis carolinensis]|eukprot:XP_016851393.1 PREDICTED: protein CC2D2B isoform X2 [Anolis carolinensis]
MCPKNEQKRRDRVKLEKYLIKIYYNNKLVSSTPEAPLCQEFKVMFQQMFRIQVLNWPESLCLEIFKSSKKPSLLARVYLAVPSVFILKSKDVLDEVEFSCEQQVYPLDGAVGSNVPFLLENETEELCILTSGKVIYSLFWAVDDKGVPLAPTFQPISVGSTSMSRNVRSGRGIGTWWHSDIQKCIEWANEANIDPNDPDYTDLFELITYARSLEQSNSKYFRLEQLHEEFNFVTAEEIENCKRFQLLQLRSLGQLDFYCFQQIPLYDREISDTIFQISVHPFVEVTFQNTVYQTSTADGSHPCWNEELQVDFTSPGHDYTFSGLSKIKDNININIFDEFVIEKHEEVCPKTCSGHSYVRKNWLGSVTFPFSALLEQSKICGTFQVSTPPILLGYTWSKTYVPPKEECYGQNLKEYTFLTIFATVEPQLSSAENNLQPDKLINSEDETLLQRAYIFKQACKMLFPKRRIITSVFDNQGRNVLVTKYITPLNPPQVLLDMYPDDPNSISDLVSRFVSLIPCMSDTVDENGDVDIWMTSEGKVAYVASQENGEFFLWNPLSGQCYKQFDAFCPLQSVDCLINQENVWFNMQQNSSPMCVSFDISKECFWKQMLPVIPQDLKTQTVQPKKIHYIPTDESLIEELQNRIEKTLKNKIMEWRSQHPTRWHRQCTNVLRQLLPKLEFRNGHTAKEKEENYLETFHEHYWVTGFPIQMLYLDVQSITEAVYQTGIHSSEVPNTEFALAVYIHPYPNNMLSVWIYLVSLIRHQ